MKIRQCILVVVVLIISIVSAQKWKLKKTNTECANQSNEFYLGNFETVEGCKIACKDSTKCMETKTIIYGKGDKKGSCWSEGVTNENCTSWEDDEFDFYQMEELDRWNKWRSDRECGNNDPEFKLGVFDTLDECTAACERNSDCRKTMTIIYGKGGKAGHCWSEGLRASDCKTWAVDQYDFYQYMTKPYCLQYESNGDCAKCDNGSLLQEFGDSCKSLFRAYCLEYESNGDCAKCESGSSLQKLGECQKCPENCTTCTYTCNGEDIFKIGGLHDIYQPDNGVRKCTDWFKGCTVCDTGFRLTADERCEAGEVCHNDDSKTDSTGDTCSGLYDEDSSECGKNDTSDFIASELCCACKSRMRRKL